MPVKVRPNGNYKCRMAASGWHPAHFTQKTCSFQVKTGLLHPLILKQMRQPLFIFNCRPNTVPIFPLFWWQFSENAALGKQHRPSKQPFTGLLWIFQENGLSNVIPNENRTRSLLRSFSLFLYISSCRKIPFH